MEKMGARSPRKYQNGWKLMLEEYNQCLKDIDPSYVTDLVLVTNDAKLMWDMDEDIRDEYNRRAKEEREEYKRMAEQKGLTKEKKTKVQALLKTRCSPKSIGEMMQILDKNEEKMRAIEEMGFGSLKYLPIVNLDLKLVRKLLDRFDAVSCSLDGEKITDADVKNVLGIPARGLPIPNSLSDADSESAFKAKFMNKSLLTLANAVKSSEEADVSFKETFLLFVLGHFLCPNVKDVPSQKLYAALSILSDAPQYNWANFVLHWLVQSIKDYQKRGGGIAGCIYVLMIIYLHRVCPLHVDGDKPLMFAWTNEKIKIAVDKVDTDEEKPVLNDNIQELYRWVQELDCRMAKLEKGKRKKREEEEKKELQPQQQNMYEHNDESRALKCLASNSRISDEVINLYVSYLQRTSSKDCLFLNSFFYLKLEFEKTLYTKLRKWWEGNLFQYSFIFLPIFENEHWSLVIICFLAKEKGKGPVLLHLDSFEMHPSELIFDKIARLLKEEWKYLKEESCSDIPIADNIWQDLPARIVRKIVEVPQQMNSSDCGIYVMYFMKLFLEKASEKFKFKDLDMFGRNWFDQGDVYASKEAFMKIIEDELKRSPDIFLKKKKRREGKSRREEEKAEDENKMADGEDENAEDEMADAIDVSAYKMPTPRPLEEGPSPPPSPIKKRSDKHGEKRIMSKRVNKLKGGNMTKKLKLGNLNELMWREFK